MALEIDRQVRAGVVWVTGISRGDVYWASVRPAHAVASEQHHDVPSPWLVVSGNAVHARFPIVIAVPFTTQVTKADGFRGARILVPEAHKLPGRGGATLPGDSLALTEQIRVLAHERLTKGPVARLSKAAMASVEAALKHVLDMP